MKKIKIGIFIDNFFPQVDGVVVTVDNYAKNLAKYADVVVIAPSYGKEENKKIKLPYRVIRVKSVYLSLIKYNVATPNFDLKLMNALKKEHFDIIHIHSPFPIGKLGLRLGKEENIPVVATMHSQFKKDFKRYAKSEHLSLFMTKQLMKTFNECNECWAVNKKMSELFQEYGYAGTPLVMHNATDMEPVKDLLEARKIVNKKYKLDDKEILLLFVGRINILKNILFIVEVLNVLKQRNFKFKMLFVGSGSDMGELKRKVKEYKLTNEIKYAGMVKDRHLLASIYARSDLFIFPSMYDASSLVQIEAASQHTPTIFLENSITSSTTKNNVNGYIGPHNAELFAKKIISIFHNPKNYQKVSENAYCDIYKRYVDISLEVYNRYLKIISVYKKKIHL